MAREIGDNCEACGVHRDDEALRSIQMKIGPRQLLCRSCFGDAVGEGEVHPADPRVEGGGR